MFTGIIRHMGTIRQKKRSDGGLRLMVEAPQLEAQVGDSIAVEGACLTVTHVLGPTLSFDLSLETLALTTLGLLPEGRPVNLEPSLRVGDGLGGHFVQGHVDGLAEVVEVHPEGDGYRLRIRAPESLLPYLALKGSATLNGVSLTVALKDGQAFDFALIPFTFENTTLSLLRPEDRLNLEVDVIARYLQSLLAGFSLKEVPS